eukprot:comp12823_c0_seq1/m.7974 comp12823_c0_seq1/g.7974  ORF comp12823_c0_seq1/g.7974 comp12823_c0_seq1/m.7974 type:complete len:396 (-) comp12823_c0_seq1:499-1686(-)
MTAAINAFGELRLTETGRPTYLEGETEIMFQGQVGLYNGDEKTNHPEGTAHLTTHRIFFLADAPGKRIALALQLCDIAMVEYTKKFLRQSPKVTLHINEPYKGHIKMSFRGSGHQEFFEQLQLALQKAEWTKPPPSAGSAGAPAAKRVSSGFDTSRAGIAGLQRAKEEDRQATEKELKEAFDDLNSLMAKAKDMVGLAEKLQAKLAKQTASDDETAQFRNYMLSLGLVAPVTKDSAGTEQQYFRELARELADFVLKPLKDQGGTMPLTDIYCLYNRARGSQLISPDDLLNACRLFEPLNLPVRMRSFPSGVHVVQLVSQTDEAIARAIGAMFKHGEATTVAECICMTPQEYAQVRNIPITLAKEQLLTAETHGMVCRDDGFEGLRFYSNLFAVMV